MSSTRLRQIAWLSRCAVDAGHELAVDLQLVERQILQIAEARIAAAEIVDGEADAQRAQLAEQGEGPLGILRGGGLGQLELERARLEAVPFERPLDHLPEIGVPKLGRGEVDRDLQAIEAALAPAPHLAAGRVQRPAPDLVDQVGILEDRNEVGRRDHARVSG